MLIEAPPGAASVMRFRARLSVCANVPRRPPHARRSPAPVVVSADPAFSVGARTASNNCFACNAPREYGHVFAAPARAGRTGVKNAG